MAREIDGIPIPVRLERLPSGERRATFPAAIAYAIEDAINKVLERAAADLLPACPPWGLDLPQDGRAYVRLVFERSSIPAAPESKGEGFAAKIMGDADKIAGHIHDTRKRPAPNTPVPAGTECVACRSCRAPIYWVTTPRGNHMPVDCDVAGGWRPQPASVGVHEKDGLGLPHFVTCPQGDRWRQNSTRRPK